MGTFDSSFSQYKLLFSVQYTQDGSYDVGVGWSKVTSGAWKVVKQEDRWISMENGLLNEDQTLRTCFPVFILFSDERI